MEIGNLLRSRRVAPYITWIATALGCLAAFQAHTQPTSAWSLIHWKAERTGALPGANPQTADSSGNVFFTGTAANGENFDLHVYKVSGSTGTMLWSRTLNGPGNGEDLGSAIAVDPNAHVVVTALLQTAPSVYQLAVIKYDGASGSQLWKLTFPNAARYGHQGVVVGTDGAVYVAGAAAGSPSAFRVMKLDGATGQVLWNVTRGGAGTFGAEANAIALDSSNNVVVVGREGIDANQGDMLTLKLNGSNGSPLWEAKFDGSAHQDDAAYAVAIDAGGNVAVTGKSSEGTSGLYLHHARAIKYTSSGTQVWAVAYAPSATTGAYGGSVALDSAGNVIVGALSWESPNPTARVFKYAAATGTEVWNRSTVTTLFDGRPVTVAVAQNDDVLTCVSEQNSPRVALVSRHGPADGVPVWTHRSSSNMQANGRGCRGMAIDPQGHVLASVYGEDPGGAFLALKLNGTTGTQTWITAQPDVAQTHFVTGTQASRALAVDAAGNAVVVGHTKTPGGNRAHTVKFLADGSATAWSATYAPGPSGPWYSTANAVAVNATGDVFVTGQVLDNWPAGSIRTEKYSAANGERLWSATLDMDFVKDTEAGHAIAVDAAGNVIVAGTGPTWGSNGSPMRVVKYDGATGAQLWVTSFDTTHSGVAVALAITPEGHVVVTGHNSASGFPSRSIRTIKLNGATGAQLWLADFDISGSEGGGAAVVVDGEGHVIVGGVNGASRGLALKYHGTTGAQLWASTDTAFGAVNGVATDAQGNVYVTGYRFTVLQGVRQLQMHTARLAAATGAIQWSALEGTAGNKPNQGTGIRVDASGNVLVSGHTWDAASGLNIRTSKYRGTTGESLWTRSADGGANGDDYGYGLTLGPGNSIYVFGLAMYEGYPRGFAVEKLLDTPPAVPTRAASDFNGDGRSDLLWYNIATGMLHQMQMNGMTLGTSGLVDQETDLNWKVAAVGDLNNDGRADVVWQHDTTGQVYGLLMNGTAVSGEGVIYTEPNTQWKVVGAGDFNGDGNADLLWKNNATGDVFLLLMNGLNVVGGGVIYSEPNTSWQIQKVADFNGDGRADVLWKNVATGDVFVLLMNGTTVTGGGVIYSEPNTAWQIQAAADFNGDGRADVLWRNTTTGDVFMMLMNGTTITGGSVFYGEPNADWKIVATGDYNGDGRADILWRNTSTGQVFMMLMNGFTLTGGGFIYTEPDQQWKILGP